MSEITVRALTEDDWETYREARLAALKESPEAFVASLEDEEQFDEQEWRDRMNRSQRLVAEVDGDRVGVASIGAFDGGDEPGAAGQLFGLWVSPNWRGKSVAAELVRQGAKHAREKGLDHLYYWVGTENGRAVAFASSFGFRPTDERREVRVKNDFDGDHELAMVLPLGKDRG